MALFRQLMVKGGGEEGGGFKPSISFFHVLFIMEKAKSLLKPAHDMLVLIVSALSNYLNKYAHLHSGTTYLPLCLSLHHYPYMFAFEIVPCKIEWNV